MGQAAVYNLAVTAVLPLGPASDPATSVTLLLAAGDPYVSVIGGPDGPFSFAYSVWYRPDGHTDYQYAGAWPYGTQSGMTDNATYTITGLMPDTAYDFKVGAWIDAAGYPIGMGFYSGDCDPISATTLNAAPAAPTGLTGAYQSSSQIQLGWQDNSYNEIGWVIQRSADPTFSTGVTTFHIGADVAAYTDSNLASLSAGSGGAGASGGSGGSGGVANTGIIYYRVAAQNDIGTSDYSNTLAVDLLPPPPGLAPAVVAPDESGIELAWSAPTAPSLSTTIARMPLVLYGAPPTGYLVQRSSDAGSTFTTLATVAADTTTYLDRTADLAESYTYRVVALSAVCTGPATCAAAPAGLYRTNTSNQVNNTPVALPLTAYQPGGTLAAAVAPAVIATNDPSNYVILADNAYTLDSAEIDNNLDYNSYVLDNPLKTGGKIDLTNPSLARIVLHKIPNVTGDVTVTLTLSDDDGTPYAGSVRLFDSNGHLLLNDADNSNPEPSSVSDTTFSYTFNGANPADTKCTYLSDLRSGDVTFYVEGVTYDPNLVISYSYTGLATPVTVHMDVAQITLMDANGNTDPIWSNMVTQQDLTDATSADPFLCSVADEDLYISERKVLIDGLHANQLSQFAITWDPAGDSVPVSFTDTTAGCESTQFYVQCEPDSTSTQSVSYVSVCVSPLSLSQNPPILLMQSATLIASQVGSSSASQPATQPAPNSAQAPTTQRNINILYEPMMSDSDICWTTGEDTPPDDQLVPHFDYASPKNSGNSVQDFEDSGPISQSVFINEVWDSPGMASQVKESASKYHIPAQALFATILYECIDNTTGYERSKDFRQNAIDKLLGGLLVGDGRCFGVSHVCAHEAICMGVIDPWLFANFVRKRTHNYSPPAAKLTPNATNIVLVTDYLMTLEGNLDTRAALIAAYSKKALELLNAGTMSKSYFTNAFGVPTSFMPKVEHELANWAAPDTTSVDWPLIQYVLVAHQAGFITNMTGNQLQDLLNSGSQHENDLQKTIMCAYALAECINANWASLGPGVPAR